MLVRCVECGSVERSNESPLWFHCSDCLHPKKEKTYKCGICLQPYKPSESDFINFCNPCGKRYRDSMVRDSVMGYCDGCGDDFPKTHLVYINTYSGYYCDRCVESG